MKGKVSVNKDETPKRKVGRPRKRIDADAKSRRTAQNRAAQRAFRDRKEAKLKSLQERTELLEQRDAQNKITTDFLQGSLRSLLSEISKYRAKNSDDERILAFLDNLQEEQRDEEQQKREYKEKETTTVISKSTEGLPSPSLSVNTTVITDTEVQPHTQESGKFIWTMGLCNTPRLTNMWDSSPSDRTGAIIIGDKSTSTSENRDCSLGFVFSDGQTGTEGLDYEIHNHLSGHSEGLTAEKIDSLPCLNEIDQEYFSHEVEDDILLSSVLPLAIDSKCDNICNGKCTGIKSSLNKEIKCELITRHLLNQESLASVLPMPAPREKIFGTQSEAIEHITSAISNEKASCCRILEKISSLPKYSSLDIDNLCNELMTKAKCTDDCKIAVQAHDLQSALVRQLL